MGASSSKNVDTSVPGETTVLAPQNELPVSVRAQERLPDLNFQFAPSLLSSLADSGSASATAARQSTLDAHIRSRIAAELEKLKADEQDIQRELARALQQENAEREASKPGRLSSPALQSQLDQVRKKIERHRQRRDGIEERIKPTRDAVIACYRKNPSRTLDCYEEVEKFVASVSALQAEFAKAT